MRYNEGAAMSKVADKLVACAFGGDELRNLLGHEPDGNIIKDAEEVFGEKGHFNLFSEIALQIRQEESELHDFCKRVEDAAKDKEELDLFGVAYTPLPTDANGVPVRVGDMLQARRCVGGWFEPFEVDRISLGRGGWSVQERRGVRHFVDACRHYKPQTVEDLIESYRVKYYRLVLEMECGNITNDEYEQSIKELNEEYAKLLRLKVEHDD